MRAFWGWNTTLHVQNLSSNSANVRVDYYPKNGGTGPYQTDPLCTDVLSIAPHGHGAIDHGGTTCMSAHGYQVFAARIRETGGRPIAAVINQDNALERDFQSYDAFIGGETWLILPYVRFYQDQDEDWACSIRVFNTTAVDDMRVRVNFYNTAGTSVGGHTCYLEPYGACLLYDSEIPDQFKGTAVINAEEPVAVVINLLNSTLRDGGMSYGATEQKRATGLSILGQESLSWD
jgi:hypothetical protein